MPSSLHYHITDVVSLIQFFHPRSVLDVGCGFGRWGFLAREYCDIIAERYERSSWLTRIDAVEVFPAYICDHHRYIYNNIYISRIEDCLARLPQYDVIIAGEILEHIEKERSLETLKALRQKATRALICSVPLGEDWPQGETLGNPHEAHVSQWTADELRALGAGFLKTYECGESEYAVAVWSRIPIKVK